MRDLSMTSISGATKGIAAWCPTFCLGYWFLYLDGHAFVLALVLGPLIWPLVDRSSGVKRLLLASPDAPYERCWSNSGDIWLSMKAPRYFLLLGSPSTKQGSRGLAFGRCLPTGRILRCRSLPQPRTPCCLRLQIPNPFLALVELYLLAFSWWCLAPVVTYGIHCISSTW